MSSYRALVTKHTERGGKASHIEEDPELGRREIEYQTYDCRYCDAEGIESKADFDTWAEVWPGVRNHLENEHPEKLDD